MSDEWGPWIEHDGKGCPCVGAFMHIVFDQGFPLERVCKVRGLPGAWIHDVPVSARLNGRIIRYRIRKPRGLTILENLIADLPAPTRETVTQ